MIGRTILERITRNNSAICLIDHQVGLLLGVRDITVAELKHNVVGLAKAAKILGMPIIASTAAKDVLWGPAYSALAAGYKSYVVVDASGVLSATNRQVGIARIQQAGVIPVDYFSIVCEIMATNADPLANDVYAALDLDFATLLGRITDAITSRQKRDRKSVV